MRYNTIATKALVRDSSTINLD